MSHSLIWLPSVLTAAGLKVAIVDGWETRGRGDVGQIFGVICHHTVGKKEGNMPSLRTLINGRPDLMGPLAQLGLGRDGTYYVIAAGRCNHAGKGIWQGLTNGNANFVAIEAENTGLANDLPWPQVQLDAYHHGAAALLRHIKQGAEFCAGHKEYALPRGRKPDPSFDMISFRSAVATILTGNASEPTLIPSIASNGRLTLRRCAIGELVKQVQIKVGVKVDGDFGAKTEAAVRVYQRANGLVPDGIVGPKTWKALEVGEEFSSDTHTGTDNFTNLITVPPGRNGF